MRAEIKYYNDMWQEIKDSALFTIHKDNGKYPTSEWKDEMLLAEHSPIRNGFIIVDLYDIPNFVAMHLVRHHEGFTPFVASNRKDRTTYTDGKVPDRNTPTNLRFNGSFQAFINISRKRICNCASAETRYVWKLVKQVVEEVEPELAKRMVRECVYRNGFCPEKYSCHYNTDPKSREAFKKELDEYLDGHESQNYYAAIKLDNEIN